MTKITLPKATIICDFTSISIELNYGGLGNAHGILHGYFLTCEQAEKILERAIETKDCTETTSPCSDCQEAMTDIIAILTGERG